MRGAFAVLVFAGLAACLPVEYVGLWRGEVSTPWSRDYAVVLALWEDGLYSCHSFANTPCFYYGDNNYESPMKRIELRGSEGDIDIYWSFSNRTTRGQLSNWVRKVVDDREELSFEFYNTWLSPNHKYGPILFKLLRISSGVKMCPDFCHGVGECDYFTQQCIDPAASTPKSGDSPYSGPFDSATEPYSGPFVSGESGVCTDDAKLCWDGTAVGRSGPNCEFDSCPVPAILILAFICCGVALVALVAACVFRCVRSKKAVKEPQPQTPQMVYWALYPTDGFQYVQQVNAVQLE